MELQLSDWHEQGKLIKRFFKDKNAVKHFPSLGEGTISGMIVDADEKTGLAKKVSRIIVGGSLVQ